MLLLVENHLSMDITTITTTPSAIHSNRNKASSAKGGGGGGGGGLQTLRKRYQKEKTALRKYYWQLVVHNNLTAAEPDVVTEENWRRKRRRCAVEHHAFDGNQYTVKGGASACTTIAFIAACRMATKERGKEIVNDIKWSEVLAKGSNLWVDLMSASDDKQLDGQKHVSLYDISKRSQIKRAETIRYVLEHAIEFTGSMDPDVNAAINNEDTKWLYNLGEFLEAMHTQRPAVAILTVSKTSVALWCGGGGNDSWALYDSHGTINKPTSSFVTLVQGGGGGGGGGSGGGTSDMESVVRALFPLYSSGGIKLETIIGNKSETVYYSASLLKVSDLLACRGGGGGTVQE